MVKIATAYQIGELVKGEGVYLGEWHPCKCDGSSLSRIFNLFAAPDDLHYTDNYNNIIKKIAELTDYHGHKGANFDNDEDLYRALKNNNYNGEWFLPTKDMLIYEPRAYGGKVTMPHGTIYDNRHKGALKYSFCLSDNGASGGFKGWDRYWSSTAISEQVAYHFNLGRKHGFGYLRNNLESAARLVRAVELTPQAIDTKFKNAITLQKPLKIKPRVRF